MPMRMDLKKAAFSIIADILSAVFSKPRVLYVSQPYDYFKSFFRLDASGKPERKFHIRVSDGPAQEIISPKHSLDILDHLRHMDVRMSELIEAFGQRLAADTHAAYDELLRLHSHASELFAQAIFLDTADRNSWDKIRSVYVKGGEPSHFSSRYDDLKQFWRGRLEQESAPGISPGF